MSAFGELFIGEDLTETARKLGILKPNEKLIIPDGYYGLYDPRDMSGDTIKIVDGVEDDDLDELSFTGEITWDEDCGYEFKIETITRNNVAIDVASGYTVGDWLINLKPIIDDFKNSDGVEQLTSEGVDWLMDTLRAKVEFVEGLISEEEYTTILSDMER